MEDTLWTEIADMDGEIFDMEIPELKQEKFDFNEYIGKEIVLGVEKVKSPQGVVDALRFSTRPLPKKEKPSIAPDRFAKALQAIADGKTTAEKLISDFNLTPEQHAEVTSK